MAKLKIIGQRNIKIGDALFLFLFAIFKDNSIGKTLLFEYQVFKVKTPLINNKAVPAFLAKVTYSLFRHGLLRKLQIKHLSTFQNEDMNRIKCFRQMLFSSKKIQLSTTSLFFVFFI